MDKYLVCIDLDSTFLNNERQILKDLATIELITSDNINFSNNHLSSPLLLKEIVFLTLMLILKPLYLHLLHF